MHVITGIFNDPHGAPYALSGVVRERGTSASGSEAST